MNNCILVAEILQDPQLRYTSDTQIEVAEMLVQFEGTWEGDPPSRVKVVAWRERAIEVQKRFRQGDRVVIEGRLSMNTIDRSEGFKEKRAELVAQRVLAWGSSEPPLSNNPATTSQTPPPPAAPPQPTPQQTYSPPAYTPAPAPPASVPPATPASTPVAPPPSEPLEDEIPF
ncbi:MAG: single-stranded DNA-binding protein [Cyanobacteriota bacterium]|nr:single-stranded DNA-binding protein [Cyanobacteriota bacterium]